jgi:GTP pyrophosphokinase
LSHKLKSGDQVEILTSKSQRVQPSWINFATTAKAKAKISGILKREQRAMQQVGEDKLLDFFKNEEIEATDANIQKLCELHEMKTPEELYAAIGFKTILLGEADRNELRKEKPTPGGWKKFIPLPFIGGKPTKEKKETKEQTPKQKIDSKKVLKLTPEALQKNFIIADCCKPIPGDDALGFIDDQDRVVIHKRKCPIADKLKAGFGSRILAVEWETGKALEFPVNLYIQGIDTMGILHQISDIVSEQLNVYIRKIFIETMDGLFEGHIQLYVHDVEDVNTIITNLQKMEEMKKVVRVEKFEDKP